MAAFSLICMAKSTASTAPSEIITKRLVSVGKGHESPSAVVVNFFWWCDRTRGGEVHQ
jgi:hypothetical protein